MSPPILLVAGLGRCGMTAMMNALAAGGIPCAGTPPAYEAPQTMFPISPAWLADQAGRAVKVLDPHRSPEAMRAPHPRVVVYMQRNLVQQATSQAKMVALLFNQRMLNRVGIRNVASALYEDNRRAYMATSPVAIRVTFEDLVTNPKATMIALWRVLQPHWSLDAEAAAAAITVRDPRCAPDLQAEHRMVEAARA